MSNPAIGELVTEWLRLDRDETTRHEIETLWKQGKVEELENRLRRRIEFGTADESSWPHGGRIFSDEQSNHNPGITGELRRDFTGLASYVMNTVSEARSKGVVVGHDHRHNSKHWARLTAAVFLKLGFEVYLHEGFVHTPLVPFSVSRLKAACGVMITASHNPKDDNGYKVYWGNAVQIISPHDKGISGSIEENLEPQTWDVQIIFSSSRLHDKTEEMRNAYFSYLRSMSVSRSQNPATTLKFVSTALHGVGHNWAVKAFHEFGFPPFESVERQKIPDPEFPTVKFPNPEEKGALDLALKQADTIKADYVLAQDPDADRFSAAERGEDGKWTVFSGDMLGTVFAMRTLELYKASGKHLDKLAMVASTVSSRMIECIAKREGFKFAECLTGFKYIGNKALDLVDQGYEVPFAYEEAIGFMIGSEIRDKDGIAATVFFAELAADLHFRGLKVSQYLNQIYSIYGYFQTCNSYFICRETSTIDRIFARLRNFNSKVKQPNYPEEIGGSHIVAVRDLTTGYDSANPPTFKPDLPLSSGHMIQFRARSDSASVTISLTIRTSGTEPKIKYYLEGNGQEVESVNKTLVKVVQDLSTEWVQSSENGLQMP